jgi:predicted O-methyltransferase YrrM
MVAADVRHAAQLRALPPRVALFQYRARRRARRTGDVFSLTSATRPRDLALLLKLADGRRQVVEIGTGTGWTSIALALADPERRVTTFEPSPRPATEGYLALARPDVRRRITFLAAAGAKGPQNSETADLLYIDSSHTREGTLAELGAWQAALAPAALVILDDYTHPDYPGVREAVQELGLTGEQCGTLFVHRHDAR